MQKKNRIDVLLHVVESEDGEKPEVYDFYNYYF